jgi:hypothetical protein
MDTPLADTLIDDPRYAATVDRVAHFVAEMARFDAERQAAADASAERVEAPCAA